MWNMAIRQYLAVGMALFMLLAGGVSARAAGSLDTVAGAAPAYTLEGRAHPAAGCPDWHANEPFELNGLQLFMTADQLRQSLGDPDREMGEGMCVYQHDAVVRLREGQMVNLSVSGALGSWSLRQKGQALLSIGDPRTKMLSVLGEPMAAYQHASRDIRIFVYSSPRCDVGVFISRDQVVGLMLAETGMLGNSLMYGDYELVPPGQ